MAENTNISWATHTFNPWVGCTKVSPACDNCYAQTLVEGRFKTAEWGAGKPRVRTSAANWRQPLKWHRKAELLQKAWQDGVDLHGGDEAACIAAGFIKPIRPRVFCASLADVFDNEVDPQWRADLVELIENTPHLDWLLLTKRIGNAQAMMRQAFEQDPFRNLGWTPDLSWPKNIWLGITVCNQTEADRDIPKLLAAPAAKRFLSIEPLLGSINLSAWTSAEHGRKIIGAQPGISWVICGGESGKNARPMHPDWARSLRDQCAAAGVAFHFKQWGEWQIASTENGHHDCDMASNNAHWVGFCGTTHKPSSLELKNAIAMVNVGTKAAGRTLDGVVHDGVPS